MVNIRRSVLIGSGGFILAGITANLATYLIFKSGLLSLLLRLVPQDQPLVRLLLGVILAFVGFGLGGAIGGLVRGHFIYQIDSSASRRRYLIGSAAAAGITQGVLVIPALLLISLLGIYNNGSEKDPSTFLVLFGVLGGLFGLIGGLLLSLLTVRLRFAWLPWLANIVGGIIGGLLLGLLVWRPEWYASIRLAPARSDYLPGAGRGDDQRRHGCAHGSGVCLGAYPARAARCREMSHRRAGRISSPSPLGAWSSS